MELCVVKGISCVKRDVENIDVYKKMYLNHIDGIPPIIDIDGKTIYYQFINGITLREYLQIYGKMSGEILTKFIFDLANILENLKDINIVHKDLKPENIVISQNKSVYLIDFDVSRLSHPKEEDTSLFGTRGYASPEHFGYSSTSFKSDMFSLGRIIEEIDEHFQYKKIASKCTEIDPRNRYECYKDLIKDLSMSGLKDKEKKERINHNIKKAYSKIIIIIYSVLFLLLMIATSSTVKGVQEWILNIVAGFYVFDIIDYIRVLIRRRKVVKFKLIVSGLVLNTYIFIAVIFELLLK